MNESLDLRKRILKMRESNNLVISNQNSLDSNLMSKFENSIKDENTKKSELVTTNNQKTRETKSKDLENIMENKISHHKKLVNPNTDYLISDNAAQFLMLANKFNEAVEVILELSQKVEKLEKNYNLNKYNPNSPKIKSNRFNFKIFIYFLIVGIMTLWLFTFPFDFSVVELIIIDVLSKI